MSQSDCPAALCQDDDCEGDVKDKDDNNGDGDEEEEEEEEEEEDDDDDDEEEEEKEDDDGDEDDDYTDVNPVVTVRLSGRLCALWFRCQ